MHLRLFGSAFAVLAFAGDAEARDLERERVELEAIVAELVPFVEEAAGRPFLEVPEVVVADPEMLKGVIYREQVHLLEEIAGMHEEEALVSARSSASDMSTAFVGKYGFLDKKLYVMREGIALALASRGVPLSEADAVTELVIAHELTHALQDQHADLARVVGQRTDGDGVIAATCTVEGHAVFVQERVGALRGHERAVDEVAAILGYDPHGTEVSLTPDGFYTAYIYGQGRNFVAWHHGRSGDEGLWAVLANPPPTTAMIMDPSRYGTAASEPFDRRTRRAVDRARDRVAPLGWKPDSEAIGDYDLRERLLTVRDTPAGLPDAWTAGWSSQASRSPVEWAEVQLLGFDDPAASQSYVAGMTLKARMDLAHAMPPVAGVVTGLPQVEGSVTPFGPFAGESATEQRFTFDFGGGSPPQRFRQVWAARGLHVVQIAVVNHDVSDRRVARSIRRVFRSLE